MKTLTKVAILLGWLAAVTSATAQFTSTAFYMTANTYSGVKGSSISITLTRQPISGPYNDWNLASSATALIYLSSSGTYGIYGGNVTNGWQNGYNNVTIPASSYSTTFTIPLVQDHTEDYDRTGTLTINNEVPNNTGYSTATITVLDNNTPMSVAIYSGGTLYTSTTILEGGLSGANQATIYFFRNQTNTQARTINYTTYSNAVAGTDYTPSIGTITIPQGSSAASVTISANNASQSVTKTLGVLLSSGIYTISANSNTTVAILQDYPAISIQASPSSIVDGTGSSTYAISRDVTYTYGAAKTVNFSVGGTAGNGTDYSPHLSTSAVLGAGVSYTNITISALANNQQTTKTAVLTLGSGNYTINPSENSATVNLLADYPSVEIVTTNNTATDGETTSAFLIYRDTYYTNGPAKTVYYAISGTASNGVDFTPTLTGSATIPAGQSAVLIPITPSSHANVVGTKELTLTLQANGAYSIGTNSSATMGLLQDAPIINVAASFAYTALAEQNGVFQITRSGGLSNTLTVNYTMSGTAISGTDYTTLPSSVTFAVNQTATNLNVVALANPPTQGKTVVLTLSSSSNYYLGGSTNAIVTIITTNTPANPPPAVGRYWRGTGSDPTYWSMVVPLDYESGTVFSNLYGNCYSLYPGLPAWSSATFYHFDATNILTQTNVANRIPFNNPIVAFGSMVGGTPLYINQDYHFGIYAGNQLTAGTPIYINAYYRSNYALAGSITLTPPNLGSSNSWNNYITNNFQITTNGFGLTVTLSDSPNMGWGVAPGGGAYMLTQSASATSTNYYYLVEAYGYPGSQATPLVLQNNTTLAPALLYTMGFEARPQWRSVFIDQPHFNGQPLPPFYAGKTVEEMLTNTPTVTNTVSLSPSACTTLDASPELRRQPILDQFVSDMNNDPLALANFVLNQIDLTDAMDYNDNGNVAEDSINLGGVSRSALGTFLERQGSPTEQCALLVYLLRQAGVPATYVFPPHDGMQILDARLSQMLKFQVHGAYSENGQLYDTNTMIPVNYPWVAAYIGTNWVHIFPWLKDYEIVEGLDLYDYMPTNYSSAYGWMKDYIYGNTNLLSLAVNGDATPRVILPAFLNQTLQANYPGISVDDLGVQIFNRPHYYARWQDFPTPTYVTNVSTAVESLGSSSITNVNPSMTNIFDTVSVEIYSVNSPNRDIQTGDLRLVDLHDRKFYITESSPATNQIQLSLVLAPIRTNIISQGSFTNDPTLISKEVMTLNLDQFDDQLNVRFKYNRHRAMSPSYSIDPNQAFFDLGASRTIVTERPLRKGDLAAICMNYGRVNSTMLNVWAQELWQMQSALAANPSLTNTISSDIYEGTTMYLAGMKYYEKCSEFDAFNRNLHKINNISTWAVGLSKISPARDTSGNLSGGNVDPILPNVDMFFYEVASAGNGTLRPDSGNTEETEAQNYNIFDVTDLSAEEHQVINSYYQQTNAVSTVRLLQLAQANGAGIVPLTIENYAAQGNTVYQGTALKNWDANLWNQVTNALLDPSTYGYATAYITPGPMTNSSYKGMGAFILGWGVWQALITPESMSGGFGVNFPDYTVDADNLDNFYLSDDPDADDFSIAMQPPDAGATLAPQQIPTFDTPIVINQINSDVYTLNAQQGQWAADVNASMDVAPQSSPNLNYSQAIQTSQSSGFLGWLSDAASQIGTKIADPVQTMTGEFYDDETDLTLNGPLPLSVRRNYSSQNLADNQFGPGWKFSIMPYLSVSQGATNIYAADMDGAVMNYVQTTTNASVWVPNLAANPQLDNNTTAGVGGLANRLRDRLVQTVNGSTTNYTLYGADGSTRTFQVMTFLNSSVNITRPYLLKWTDNRGNYYTFQYGTNSSQNDFGQVRRIVACNGNYLDFDYDIYGHIVQANSGDGRFLTYTYDDSGDLVTVTLPDNTTRSYAYQHSTQAVTNGATVTQQPYSTHLIIQEIKPDGRLLVNAYDSQRRVTNQLTTAGQDLTPIRTASFVYFNNFNVTNALGTPITGYTFVTDAASNTARFDYSNSLMTKIADPLNRTIQQTWYADNATTPGYPRSVATRIDKRGLITQYQYDSNGNVTNTTTTGDLLGNGNTNDVAVSKAVYNVNCLPVLMTDPVGNAESNIYDSTFTFLPQQVIKYAGSTPISTNYFVYGNASTVGTNGSLIFTNQAFGLPTRRIRAYNSPDAATNDSVYNGGGFLVMTVDYTGTGDSAITNYLFTNERNELIQRTDAAGRNYTFTYDDMGRPTSKETFDVGQSTPMDWSFYYYDDNGELNWIDGPRYNPEDYIYYDYDGAGRKIQEIRWRSQGNQDGSGVSAVAGYGQYATTFYQYDNLGNLTQITDPLGNYTVQSFDAACQMTKQVSYASNGVALSTNLFAYEPGGLVSYVTNALGGVTAKVYNSRGQLEFQNNPDGSTNSWRYDLSGRVAREYARNGNYWQTTYNDAGLAITKVFTSGASTLATNIVVSDRRGNVIQKTDANGNLSTNFFDGLDRIKIAAGPAIVTVSGGTNFPGFGSGPTTNVVQQIATYVYDGSGQVFTVSNALGEHTVTTSDPLGRPIRVEAFSAANASVHLTTTGYSLDHNSMTVTNGSGTNAIVTTTYTDTYGNAVLKIGYPTNGVIEYMWQQYDAAGNRIAKQQLSSNGGLVTTWSTNGWTYDGLNRVQTETSMDGATTTYTYDALGDLISRAMPGGISWNAAYLSDGRILNEQESGGGMTTRSNSYTYFSSSSPYAGLLQTKLDGRGTSTTNFTFDAFLRLTDTHTFGSAPEQNVYRHLEYDAVGNLVYFMEEPSYIQFSGVQVVRGFDPYNHVNSEYTEVDRATDYSYWNQGQSWDSAGRRASLNGLFFGYQADGRMTQSGGSSFHYANNGLMVSRTTGAKTVSVNQRDGRGRALSTTTTLNMSPILTESLSWRNDGRLSAYTANRDFTDSRNYTYSSLANRVTQESFGLSSGHSATNNYTIDNNTTGGLGIVTAVTETGGAATSWSVPGSGGLDGLSRVAQAQDTLVRRSAIGTAFGAGTVSATVDGNPLSVQYNGDVSYNGFHSDGIWRVDMDLSPGSHTLQVSAVDPSGYIFGSSNSTFNVATNAGDTIKNTYDGNGNITKRIWVNALGQTNRTQTLTWDGYDRLVAVTQRDSTSNGFNWTGCFDSLGRRIETTCDMVLTNVEVQGPLVTDSTIDSWYDPEVEFEEIGVQVDGVGYWKTVGPDINGVYGGMQGVGGVESISQDGHTTAVGVVQDYFGNVIGTISEGSLTWNASRFSSYGPAPGYQSPALSPEVGLAQSLGWRGKRVDETGLIYLGARHYDYVAGRFLNADPLGHAASMDLYSFCGGDPINHFDPDGRDAQVAWAYSSGFVEGAGEGLENEAIGVGKFAYGATVGLGEQISLTGIDAYNTYTGSDDPYESAIFKGTYNMALNGASTSDILGEGALQVSGYRFGNQIEANLEQGMETGDYSQFSQNMGTVAAIALTPKAMQVASEVQIPLPGDSTPTIPTPPAVDNPTPRLSQDINVDPDAPDAMNWQGRTVGQNANQNVMVQQDAAQAAADGATDIRINQQQVDASGTRVGVNRPDLQYTDANGNRVYVEYDTPESTRGPAHETRIQANDPSATVILKTVH